MGVVPVLPLIMFSAFGESIEFVDCGFYEEAPRTWTYRLIGFIDSIEFMLFQHCQSKTRNAWCFNFVCDEFQFINSSD